MSAGALFDRCMDRVTAGEPLGPDEIRELAVVPDILPLGMLADALRRRRHGSRVTYLRVAAWPFGGPGAAPVPSAARELRLTGSPGTLDEAVSAIRTARTQAGGRTVAACSWSDIDRLAQHHEQDVAPILTALREAGLDALAELPLDAVADPAAAVERLAAAGFDQLRLTIDRGTGSDRTALLLAAAALQERFACIQTLNPLPMTLHASRPTTGYDDVKMVAVARLAAPNVPTIQVDWPRYGPKLAQVALTFGADDLDGVSADDHAPEGRRRAPAEDIRRNIEAAGFVPSERDGRFTAAT